MSNALINPHPDIQVKGTLINDGLRRSDGAFPSNPRLAFSGEEITVVVKQIESISTIGPADGLGFAKKGLSVIAESLSYRMASKIASTKARGTVHLVLRYRENGIGGRPSGPMKQSRHIIHSTKTIPLDTNKNYKVHLEPRLSGVFAINLFVMSYRSDWWAK